MKNKTIFIETLNDCLINLFKFIEKKIKIISLFIILCFNVVMILNFNYLKNYHWIIIEIILTLLVLFNFKLDDENKKRKNKNKLPHLNKRLTQQIDGQIYIDKSDWSKAVLYLSEVEDFLENVGILKK